MKALPSLVVIAASFVVLAGCQETKEDGRDKVSGIAKSIKEGTTEAELVKRFGEPDSKEANDQAKTENSSVWRYKKLNKFYELQIRIVNGKSTWAVEQDKSAQKFTG